MTATIKTKSLFLLFFLCLLAGLTTSTGAVAKAKADKISISKQSIELGPCHLAADQDWPWQRVPSLLGPASRDLSLANIVHVYDELGLAFYQPSEGKRKESTTEIQIYFVAESIQVSPKSGFAGQLFLEKQQIDPTHTSPEQIGRALSGWKAGKAYVSHSYRWECPKLYLYGQFDKDHHRLVRLTVGNLQASLEDTFSK